MDEIIIDDMIYKVKQIIDNKIVRILVFLGDNDKSEVFTDYERNIIEQENTEVIYIDSLIHKDDTIIDIKIKIHTELKKSNLNLTPTIHELYLYSLSRESINVEDIYTLFTKEGNDIDPIKLSYIVNNMLNFDYEKNIEYKSRYNLSDLYTLGINQYDILFKQLGAKKVFEKDEYPIVGNPYVPNNFDSYFETFFRKGVSSKNILLDSQIKDNTIYLALAEDVLEYSNTNNKSIENTLKTYFPTLYSKGINDMDDLRNEGKRSKLNESSNAYLNDRNKDLFTNIGIFYKINKDEATKLNYIESGIHYINFTILPETKGKIPLEIIFKILNASKEIPLIKYNPSSNNEKTYRLYSEEETKEGKKIPMLKKATIFKLMKTIGKSKSVTAYINYDNEIITCEFDNYGNITIVSTFLKALTIVDIDLLMKNAVNPLIEKVQILFEESGYQLNQFVSIQHSTVDMNYLSYKTIIEGKKKIKMSQIQKCISQVFLNESKNNENISLRFKRVSNFNTYNSKQIFIINKINEGLRHSEIISMLVSNYADEINENDALELVQNLVTERNLQNVSKGRQKFKHNPGFEVDVQVDSNKGNIILTVDNINHLYYLETLPVYLDAFIKLSQYYDVKSKSELMTDIKSLCKTVVDKKVDIKEEMEREDTMKDEDIIEVPQEDIKETPKRNIFFESDEDEDEDDEEDESEEEEDDSGLFGGAENEDGVKDKDIDGEEEDDDIIEITEVLQENPGEIKEENLVDVSEKMEENQIEENQGEENQMEENQGEENQIEENQIEENQIEENQMEENQMEESDSEEENELLNVDNIKIQKPYYFQTRMEEKDPTLIIKKEPGRGFLTYSRTCSSSNRRQPVIVTDSELDKIKSKYANKLDEKGNRIFDETTDVIKYGSDPNNKYNYICPRYWCLKNNTMIDASELQEVEGENGEKELQHPTCGKVLPYDATHTKPGYYIYEFTDKTKGYNKNYPGFKIGKHPDGYCLPCCYSKVNKSSRKKCYDANNSQPSVQIKEEIDVKKEDDVELEKQEEVKEVKEVKEEEEKQEEEETDTKKVVNDSYIKSADKFPIQKGRWGFLPTQLQYFFKENNAECQVSKSNTQLKPNHPCLLRHGVEINVKQSFIACIADALHFNGFIKNVPTIQDFKQYLVSVISIDEFVNYHNGNLVRYFYDLNDDINIDDYRDTKIARRLKLENKEDREFYKKTISAYNNFKEFIEDDEIFIDYTYLWDIITTPHPKLFKSGVNLIILEMNDDDITNNISIVCPTNYYANNLYDARKSCLFLIKNGNYFEPIYSYKSSQKIHLIRFFSEYKKTTDSNRQLKQILKNIIKPYFNKLCTPKPSLPNIYKTKNPYNLKKMMKLLDLYNYYIQTLVKNFNNKIIGIIASAKIKKKPKKTDVYTSIFVPCFPSQQDMISKKQYEITFMNNPNVWKSYNDTFDFLKGLASKGKGRTNDYKIPCKPMVNVIEGEYVVGILTETNQFVQINPPIKEIGLAEKYIIGAIRDKNYMLNKTSLLNETSIDNISTTSSLKDKARINFVKKTEMESKFYNVFRNSVKIILNEHINYKVKERIVEILNEKNTVTSQKVIEVINILKMLIETRVEFSGDNNFYKIVENVSSCQNSCNSNMCLLTDDETCKLILPEKHLVSKKNNKEIYLLKLSDEIVRYSRIQQFMLNQNSYLSFGDTNYSINENELLIFQSLLTQDFFEDLDAFPRNKYVARNSYFNATPKKIQTNYDNTIKFNELVMEDANDDEQND